MSEEGSSNFDLELNSHNQSNDLIKLQTNFNNLQIKFNEEKEKTSNLENELKKIQKIINEDIKQLKDENVRKDGKINSLEVEIKTVNELLEKKIVELTFKLNNEIFKCVNFVKIKNKWSEFELKDDSVICCSRNCVTTNNPKRSCIKGNGYVHIISDENIKYINGVEGKRGKDAAAGVNAENSFEKPQNCLNYSLYYFEIKCKFEVDLHDYKWMVLCLNNCKTNKSIRFYATTATMVNEKYEEFKLSTFTWNNNDIFGYGLVYPPTNISNEFPYVFLTQNGKEIGKAILLTENFDSYKPHVWLEYCSIEANFGNNLETKPFKYDISKHEILKEFY
ncbi:unnamed protein product [Meloidogyne enterolobii]|uniref:Uncharacterized protein n=1 Tax=Meloidogyne enterolobii TaxID=390850 RepID=A0ACB0YXQ8_MELEN